MKNLITRFNQERRAAIALIFALCLVPLVALIALSVDYAFYVQSRAQSSLAADAACTHAVRAANATYAYELALGESQSAAFSAAQTAGQNVGLDWFYAQLGKMPTASITGTPSVVVSTNSDGSAGFTAEVKFTGTYPPFFASLFNGKVWNLFDDTKAKSAYDYVELLMLLDNSSSMLIATNSSAGNVLSMEELAVCPTSGIVANFGGNNMNEYQPGVATTSPNLSTVDVPQASFQQFNYASNYYPATSQGYTLPGYCNPGYTGTDTGTVSASKTNQQTANILPFSPCAFACHTTNTPLKLPIVSGNTVTGYTTYPNYTDDYFGLARLNNIQLRLDVVQSAASAAVTAMQTNEEAAGQFSVGIDEFSSEVQPVWPSASGGTQSGEASTDLTGAANAIQNSTPPIVPQATGNTDFMTSITDMINGTYATGVAFRANATGTQSPALTAAGNGTSATTPKKDLFIVTDGMNDSRVLNGGNGEMTGFLAENGSTTAMTPALCGQLKSMGKDLGFTVYVLYVDYNPLSNNFYQTYNLTATAYGQQDYPGLANGTSKQYAEVSQASVGAPPQGASTYAPTKPPDEIGLIACASTPSDFFEASSDSEIGQAMNAMLQAALTSTITLVQ